MKTSDFDEYLSESIKGRSPRGKATSPRRKRKDYIPLESVSEIDQYIAAQQLIAEISHQFATNKSMLESWFISSTVEEFKVWHDLNGVAYLFNLCLRQRNDCSKRSFSLWDFPLNHRRRRRLRKKRKQSPKVQIPRIILWMLEVAILVR